MNSESLVMNHRFGANSKKSKNGAFDLTMQVSYFLTLVKLFRHNPHLALLGLKFSDIMGPIKALLFILDNQKPFVQILMRVVL